MSHDPESVRHRSGARMKRLLLGIGLDGEDGHTRVTVGENFRLFGGSKDTHAEMQEKAIKLNEHLKKRGKTLDTVERRELEDIAHEIGLKPLSPPSPPSD